MSIADLLMQLDDLLTLGVREYTLVVEIIHEIRLEIEDRSLLFLDARHLSQTDRAISAKPITNQLLIVHASTMTLM